MLRSKSQNSKSRERKESWNMTAALIFYDEDAETWLFLAACEPVPESLSWLADGTCETLMLAVTKWKLRVKQAVGDSIHVIESVTRGTVNMYQSWVQ